MLLLQKERRDVDLNESVEEVGVAPVTSPGSPGIAWQPDVVCDIRNACGQA
jgi:hypothetical protein